MWNSMFLCDYVVQKSKIVHYLKMGHIPIWFLATVQGATHIPGLSILCVAAPSREFKSCSIRALNQIIRLTESHFWTKQSYALSYYNKLFIYAPKDSLMDHSSYWLKSDAKEWCNRLHFITVFYRLHGHRLKNQKWFRRVNSFIHITWDFSR
jgi:hypothetical protein